MGGARWRALARASARPLLAACGVLLFAAAVALLTDRDGDGEEVIRFPGPSPEASTTSSSSPSSSTTSTTTTTPATTASTVPATATTSGGGGGDGGAGPAPPVTAPTAYEHLWPADYDGPVWIVVETADAEPRTITVRWGPWERTIVHAAAGRRAYTFAKAPLQAGQANVPATVTIEPGPFGLAFGQGPPPDGAVDVNADWQPAPDPEPA